jgi:hypothetical protein
LQRLSLFAAAQRVVHQRTVDTRSHQLVRLILPQGDELRYDERRIVQMQRRQLIAKGFAGASGHGCQCVAPFQHAANDVFLAGAQSGNAAHVTHGLPRAAKPLL